eukprot:gb/GFBE01026538.1/.p1 GENE.gb/GFBE01026538.1/~~gb/GFBE01026538.1/.p1  ORF type:complete len:354 (+),score=80.05 gb/GFBE01026538.1/:1-1062(+)
MVSAPLYAETAFRSYMSLPVARDYRIETGILGGLDLFSNYKLVPIALAAFYLAAIFKGQKAMAKRTPWDLQWTLAAWNALLSTFSFIGAFHTIPHLLYNISFQGFTHTICAEPLSDWGSGSTGLWVQLFVLSKIPELIDTLFIVLRKKPLIFLHWYHHATVLLYCWHAMATLAPQALYFVAMNYDVHALMYAYYCLMALKCVPKWFPPVLITMAQLSQMLVGVFVQCSAVWMYLSKQQSACPVSLDNLVAGTVMYGSYFFLFFQFFVRRFVKASGVEKKQAQQSQPESEPEPKSEQRSTPRLLPRRQLSWELSSEFSKAAGFVTRCDDEARGPVLLGCTAVGLDQGLKKRSRQ